MAKKISIQLVQLNNKYGDQVYLPYSVAVLKAFVLKNKQSKLSVKTSFSEPASVIIGTTPAPTASIRLNERPSFIDACINNKIGELHLASSSEVYQTPKSIPTDEKESLKIPDIYNPRYSYGGGKILTELMGIHYGKKFFNRLIIFRPHNVYGPKMGNEHVIPEFIKKFKKLKNKNFKIQGSGNEIRSFIFIFESPSP